MRGSQITSESSAMTELVTINLDRKLQSTIGPVHEEKVKLEVGFPLPKYPFLYLFRFCLREHFFPPPLHSLTLDFSEHPPFPHPSSMEVPDSIPLSAIPLVWSRPPQSLSPKNGRECGSPAPPSISTGCLSHHTTLAASGRNCWHFQEQTLCLPWTGSHWKNYWRTYIKKTKSRRKDPRVGRNGEQINW